MEPDDSGPETPSGTPTARGTRTPGRDRQRAQREARGSNLRRYGPLTLIVVLLVAVGGIVALGGGDEAGEAGEADDGEARGPGVERAGAPAPEGRMPVTYAEAEAAGDAAGLDWGDRCDTSTGLVRLPTIYAPPCVPVFSGDNGGATGPGVTGDTITVVRYVAEGPAGQSTLAPTGEPETSEQQAETLRDYVELYASQAELYGRSVEVVDFPATGAGDDVVAARADAAQIAAELQPFAVLSGPQLDRGAFAQELSANGILCLDCAGPVSLEMREAMAPYVWGSLPSGEQFIDTLTAWASALSRDPEADEAEVEAASLASFAGDEAMRDRPRKIGIIHFDQDPPVFAVDESELDAGLDLIDSYVLDFATLPQKAAELVARFQAEDITTVVFLGDPVMPGYLTRAATEAGWFPEWVFTGTFLTDTNAFGRGADAEQMAHAFGISQVAAPTTTDLSDAVRLYRWYFGADAFPSARTQYPLSQFAARFLVDGIHMAGPDLDAETFATGLFRIPPAGGGPTTPQVSYGNWGFFPDTDYSGIDDASEIWWDPTVAVDDEFGKPGTGAWRRAHDGDRFVNESDAPAPDPFGDPARTVTVVDELPAEDTPPEYPSPPGSPAAAQEAR